MKAIITRKEGNKRIGYMSIMGVTCLADAENKFRTFNKLKEYPFYYGYIARWEGIEKQKNYRKSDSFIEV